MTREKAIDIINAERECVCRQGRTGECCRDDLGCGACDLVQEDVDIIDAYDMAIEALNRPHEEWIWKSYNPDYDCGDIVCSRCSIVIYEGVINERLAYISWNFCPNCGADMRKEGDPD